MGGGDGGAIDVSLLLGPDDPRFWDGPLDEAELEPFAWATAIVADEFAQGLSRWTEKAFVRQRYDQFVRRNDPIAARIVEALGDDALRRGFVSYWTIAQTIVSQSRFWLDVALIRILLERPDRDGTGVEVHSPSLMGARWTRDTPPLTLDMLGELRKEGHFLRGKWRVGLQASCLRAIDLLVGDQERDREQALGFRRGDGRDDMLALEAAKGRDLDHAWHVADALRGPPAEDVNLQCNLIVIEPDRRDDRVHAWAIRLKNPKLMSSPAERKAERTNSLRVLGFLLQEKVFRTPAVVSSCVAEIVPRRTPPRRGDDPDYYSDRTYWPSWRLWKFVGVPFAAIEEGISTAGASLGTVMRENLSGVLPREER